MADKNNICFYYNGYDYDIPYSDEFYELWLHTPLWEFDKVIGYIEKKSLNQKKYLTF